MRRITVGTDGTEHGRSAVQWAAHEAVLRGAALDIVCAFEWSWEAQYESGTENVDIARQLAEAVTSKALAQARAVEPAVVVDSDARCGNTVMQLLQAADETNADLIVVGSRGHGGFASLMLGSVSQRIATHANRPVVVVRGRAETAAGPIAVGVDDSPAADLVLATAFEAARERGATLSVIRTFLPPAPLWVGTDIVPTDIDTPELDAAERERVNEQLAPWRNKYADVLVETLLSHDSAAAVLVGVSHGAQLVVVGSRGRGALAGTLLGSTGLQLLHHADCPVLIARAVPEAAR